MQRSLEIFAKELYHQMLTHDGELKALNERLYSLTLVESISLKKAWASTLKHFYPNATCETEETDFGNSLDEAMVFTIRQFARKYVPDATKYFSDVYSAEFRDRKNAVDAMNSKFKPRAKS